MKKLISLLITLFLLNAGNALADHHGYVQTDLLENDRVRVILATIKPGAESPSVSMKMDQRYGLLTKQVMSYLLISLKISKNTQSKILGNRPLFYK